MDRTIRNIDDEVYRALKARAALQGRGVGEVVTDAIRAWLNRPASTGRGTLRDLRPLSFGPGNERLSEQIDEIVYGERIRS